MDICRATHPQHGSAFDLHRLHRTHIILAIIDHSQSFVYGDSSLVFELRGFRMVFRPPENITARWGTGQLIVDVVDFMVVRQIFQRIFGKDRL